MSVADTFQSQLASLDQQQHHPDGTAAAAADLSQDSIPNIGNNHNLSLSRESDATASEGLGDSRRALLLQQQQSANSSSGHNLLQRAGSLQRGTGTGGSPLLRPRSTSGGGRRDGGGGNTNTSSNLVSPRSPRPTSAGTLGSARMSRADLATGSGVGADSLDAARNSMSSTPPRMLARQGSSTSNRESVTPGSAATGGAAVSGSGSGGSGGAGGGGGGGGRTNSDEYNSAAGSTVNSLSIARRDSSSTASKGTNNTAQLSPVPSGTIAAITMSDSETFFASPPSPTPAAAANTNAIAAPAAGRDSSVSSLPMQHASSLTADGSGLQQQQQHLASESGSDLQRQDSSLMPTGGAQGAEPPHSPSSPNPVPFVSNSSNNNNSSAAVLPPGSSLPPHNNSFGSGSLSSPTNNNPDRLSGSSSRISIRNLRSLSRALQDLPPEAIESFGSMMGLNTAAAAATSASRGASASTPAVNSAAAGAASTPSLEGENGSGNPLLNRETTPTPGLIDMSFGMTSGGGGDQVTPVRAQQQLVQHQYNQPHVRAAVDLMFEDIEHMADGMGVSLVSLPDDIEYAPNSPMYVRSEGDESGFGGVGSSSDAGGSPKNTSNSIDFSDNNMMKMMGGRGKIKKPRKLKAVEMRPDEVEGYLDEVNEAESDEILLTHVHLTAVPLVVLSMAFVRTLVLSKNKIETLPPELFTCLPLIQEIDVSENQIASIPVEFFTRCPSLDKISLDHNHLTSFGDDRVSEEQWNLPVLREIGLEWNNLAVFPNNVVLFLPALQKLFLSENSNMVVGIDALEAMLQHTESTARKKEADAVAAVRMAGGSVAEQERQRRRSSDSAASSLANSQRRTLRRKSSAFMAASSNTGTSAPLAIAMRRMSTSQRTTTSDGAGSGDPLVLRAAQRRTTSPPEPPQQSPPMSSAQGNNSSQGNTGASQLAQIDMMQPLEQLAAGESQQQQQQQHEQTDLFEQFQTSNDRLLQEDCSDGDSHRALKMSASALSDTARAQQQEFARARQLTSNPQDLHEQLQSRAKSEEQQQQQQQNSSPLRQRGDKKKQKKDNDDDDDSGSDTSGPGIVRQPVRLNTTSTPPHNISPSVNSGERKLSKSGGISPDPICNLSMADMLLINSCEYVAQNPALAADAAAFLRKSAQDVLLIRLDNSPSAKALLHPQLAHLLHEDHFIMIDWNEVFPDEIIDGLYLGGVTSVQSPFVFEQLGITHVLTAARDVDPDVTGGVMHKKLLLDDFPNEDITLVFNDAHKFIDEARFPSSGGAAAEAASSSSSSPAATGGVVVHCFMGMSRSATIVISYLMKKQGMSLDDALDLCRERRPKVCPNDGFIHSLRRYEALLKAEEKRKQQQQQQQQVPALDQQQFQRTNSQGTDSFASPQQSPTTRQRLDGISTQSNAGEDPPSPAPSSPATLATTATGADASPLGAASPLAVLPAHSPPAGSAAALLRLARSGSSHGNFSSSSRSIGTGLGAAQQRGGGYSSFAESQNTSSGRNNTNPDSSSSALDDSFVANRNSSHSLGAVSPRGATTIESLSAEPSIGADLSHSGDEQITTVPQPQPHPARGIITGAPTMVRTTRVQVGGSPSPVQGVVDGGGGGGGGSNSSTRLGSRIGGGVGADSSGDSGENLSMLMSSGDDGFVALTPHGSTGGSSGNSTSRVVLSQAQQQQQQHPLVAQQQSSTARLDRSGSLLGMLPGGGPVPPSHQRRPGSSSSPRYSPAASLSSSHTIPFAGPQGGASSTSHPSGNTTVAGNMSGSAGAVDKSLNRRSSFHSSNGENGEEES